MSINRFALYLGSLGLLAYAGVARTQETDTVHVAPATQVHASSSVANAVMARTFAVHVQNMSLGDALAAVSEASGITFVFNGTRMPLQRTVSLVADKISVGDALHVLLQGTGFSAIVAPSGSVVLIPDTRTAMLTPKMQQGTATITGSVVDSGTGAAIPQVIVHIDGTSLSVKSSADGQYKFTNIAAGEYRVTVRRVGYLAKTRTITLVDGDNKKLDFGLNPPATQLNEVVTTALGEQRRYQVGNVISTINVDSVAPNAPVTSVTDLLAARVPGLEVVQSSGLAGSGPAIRIRGQSSLEFQTDPIIIVDGIRVDNTPGNNNQLNFGGPAPARINDLDFNEIESISVLKGPTATTEYGTDAANGVIVITTKRGHAGTPTWYASATESAVLIPGTFPNYYWDWVHVPDGTATPLWGPEGGYEVCNLGAYVIDPGRNNLLGGGCVVDSISVFNPLNHAATTEYGTGPSNDYELSVDGGTDQIRYYLAGNMENEEGLVHVPDVLRPEALAVGYSNSALNPNSQNQSRLTANGVIQLSPKVTVTVQGGYTNTYAEMPWGGGFSPSDIGSGPTVDDSAGLYGYSPVGNNQTGDSPLAFLGRSASQGTEAWRGSSTINWQPAPWAAAHLTTGIQHEAQTDQSTFSSQAGLVATDFSDSADGEITMDQIRYDTYTVDFAASATVVPTRLIHLVTTVGAQYVQSTSQGVTAEAYNLAASSFTLNDAPSGDISIRQSGSEASTEGVYAEEQVNLGDWCFMPLALRIDAGSAFGSGVTSQNYPKWGLSCLVLTGRTTLRLRGSYGAAGRQPPEGSAASQYYPTSYQASNASTTTAYVFSNPGNPDLRPEDDREWEYGGELSLWNNRLNVSVTGYNDYAHNDLYQLGLGLLLQGSYWENIGDVRNMGWELETNVVALETRSVTASLNLSGSINHNKLLRLAPNILSAAPGAAQWFVPGYPLYSYFGDSVRYSDLNHDGLLEPNEVYVQPNNTYPIPPSLYMGSSLPIKQMAAAPSLAFFPHGLVQVNAVFQYQGGYKVEDGDNIAEDGQAVNTLGTPLWLQAYDLANYKNIGFGDYAADQLLDGSYLSWNELSLAVGLPASWVRAMHIHDAHVVLGVQNLALWTAYPFGDPRVSNGDGSSTNAATGISTANNDLRATSAAAVPLARTWMVRLNLGL